MRNDTHSPNMFRAMVQTIVVAFAWLRIKAA